MESNKDEKNEDNCESEKMYKSLDMDMIRKNLKATHVKVHIDNLVPPKDGHRIRSLNDKHVQELVKLFQNSFQPYTVLIGLATEEVDIERLCIPKQESVEILGGNHTVAALKQLASLEQGDDTYKYVYIDIYTKLSEAQALALSYKHNELHENSQELSFCDKVMFFHTSFLKNKQMYSGKPQKHISMRWRSEIGAILNKSKIEMKNSYKVHFSLAAYEDDIWNLIKDVFDAFENHKIKGQKKLEKCSQYCFANFSKVKDNGQKIKLLENLSSGKITPEEFRSACLSGGKSLEKTSTTIKISHTTKEKSQKRTESNEEDKDNFEEKMRDIKKQLKDTKTDLENLKQENNHLTRQLQDNEKDIQLKDTQLETKEKQILQLKKTMVEYIDIMKRMKALDNKSKAKIDELQRSLKEERDRCQLAEEAAARARTTEKVSLVEHSIKRKVDSTQIDGTKKMKSEKDNEANGPSAFRAEEKEVVLVEYTKGKIYFAIKDGDFLTYCQRPVGVLRDGQFVYSPQKLSFIVNEKDKQTFEKQYVICSMKCCLSGKCIKADRMSLTLEHQIQAIQKYSEQNI